MADPFMNGHRAELTALAARYGAILVTHKFLKPLDPLPRYRAFHIALEDAIGVNGQAPIIVTHVRTLHRRFQSRRSPHRSAPALSPALPNRVAMLPASSSYSD